MTKQELLAKIATCDSADEATELAARLVLLYTSRLIPLRTIVAHFADACSDILEQSPALENVTRSADGRLTADATLRPRPPIPIVDIDVVEKDPYLTPFTRGSHTGVSMQKLISGKHFHSTQEIQEHLDIGYRVVPGTFILYSAEYRPLLSGGKESPTAFELYLTVVVEKD